jgi:hypothetical protein
LNRLTIRFDRLVDLALRLQSTTQVAMEVQLSPVQCNRSANVLDGTFVIANFVANGPLQVPRIGVIRIYRQNLPVKLSAVPSWPTW